jgi:hypothetical protein
MAQPGGHLCMGLWPNFTSHAGYTGNSYHVSNDNNPKQGEYQTLPFTVYPNATYPLLGPHISCGVSFKFCVMESPVVTTPHLVLASISRCEVQPKLEALTHQSCNSLAVVIPRASFRHICTWHLPSLLAWIEGGW